MNDVIFETVITTVAVDGTPHVAPMGVRYREAAADRDGDGDGGNHGRRGMGDGDTCGAGDDVILMPFKPSTTLANILATRRAVLNVVTDTRVFAGAVTGRRSWPLTSADRIAGARLSCALSHVELRLAELQDDPQRPLLRMARVFEARHAPFIGFNRAQAAVIEGAVLVSRLHLLPAEKVDAEMRYLQIAIDKTAGPDEREAWGWLAEAIGRHRDRDASLRPASVKPDGPEASASPPMSVSPSMPKAPASPSSSSSHAPARPIHESASTSPAASSPSKQPSESS